MSSKRKRRTVQQLEGLAAGEKLKRQNLTTDTSPWGWVGTEVTNASDITAEHRLATCNFAQRSTASFCPNKFAQKRPASVEPARQVTPADGELADDVIVISEDEAPNCSKRACKKNPNCLNYLGQDKWENEDGAMKAYLATMKLGHDPQLDDRKAGLPVGLKNLGATCYANAFIQVWYQDLAFRNGVYQCQPSQDKEHSFEDSPVFRLQATFAALQEGKKSVFNPIKLVESLKLKTNEQQDAQEFSKLFMSHLDNEFQKQLNPALKHLLADQGQQAYCTTCQECGTRSERESDFLEVEVNLENNSSLTDRIEALLQPETLSGDNQYSCSHCNSLQDATRQVILRKLPPILHFSLLRFVFDLTTMERKKSKHNISFPSVLDMNRFLEPPSGPQTAKSLADESENIYDLKGVLLHKGPSAYHGHYEAMVFDVMHNSWFQFNDEVVTKKPTAMKAAEEKDKPKASQNGRPRPIAKKRRIEDSDDEVVEVDPKGQSKAPPAATTSTMMSKDAYMLVYARRGSRQEHQLQAPPKPPPRALEAVQKLNREHEEACASYQEKRDAVTSRFEELRQRMSSIYRSWHVSSHDQKSVVASQQALEQFLSRHLSKESGGSKTPNGTSKTPLESEASSRSASTIPMDTEALKVPTPLEDEISISSVVCAHGRLDPDRADDMKRIDYGAYERMVEEEGCIFQPELSPEDVCEECVRDIFIEKLYQYEHPKRVAEFDAVREAADSGNYWVSKAWLKDWRQAKPKMHEHLEEDPPPDADPYGSHVRCEHGGLSLNTTSRVRISAEACLLLKSWFPSWETLAEDTERCAICEAGIEISREDKQVMRKKAEDEKARLKHMHDNALNGNTNLLENVPCAMIPAQFVRSWRQWIMRPSLNPRPEAPNTSSFLCEHGLLAIDPNTSDLDTSVCLIRRHDWDVLEELYQACPLIAVQNRSYSDENGVSHNEFEHEIEVCAECRRKRKSDYDMTEVTIRILGVDDPNPTPETFLTASQRPNTVNGSRQTTITTYASRHFGPQRQSKRLRKATARRERRLCISKTMSVKDIKLLIQEQMDVPTICQRLFYQGHELLDNEVTVPTLGILANDVLDLREESEDVDLLDESDSEVPRKKRRDEGGGFGGTLLSGDPTSEDPPSEHTASPPTSGTCPACTFENLPTAPICSICETRL
ncbi:hypothetical protein EVG20_g4062 [Dentipellis fragilis]|uniref:Ubiquitinyl hydrolase 1 n=1 Tax=Dentipellis fragilis TaxID=205917 RepID=A0A4Y9YXU8_9AGAM|nr:hypothetical protein EVG20_g4062 [Dentipellis fragilis]